MTSFQIRCFLAAAETLNFTEAANQLFVAQSTLSRNISNLEEETGMQLFIRTKKYVRLTPSGAILFEEFSKLMRFAETAIDKARTAVLCEKGFLRVGLIETQRTDTFLPQTIGTLRQEYPNIELNLFRGNFRELREALADLRIDIALTIDFDLQDYEDGPEIVSQAFLMATGKCVISKYHPLANSEVIQIEDLKDEPLIAISPETSKGAYDNAIELCKLHGFVPQQITTAASIEDLMLMVEAGLGYGILDENSTFIQSNTLRSITIDNCKPLSLVAVWHKNNLNPAVPLFVNMLIDRRENRF